MLFSSQPVSIRIIESMHRPLLLYRNISTSWICQGTPQRFVGNVDPRKCSQLNNEQLCSCHAGVLIVQKHYWDMWY